MKTNQMTKQGTKKKNLSSNIFTEGAHKFPIIVDFEGQGKNKSIHFSYSTELHFAITHIFFLRVHACSDSTTY